MVETPLLWTSGGRKEAMELLVKLWSDGPPELRERLTNAILVGPPDDLLASIEGEERQRSRDRRIFDRLAVIERVGEPPLNPRLEAEVDRLTDAYPEWTSPEGERAYFAFWSEIRIGPDSDYSVGDLSHMASDKLAEMMRDTRGHREGLLEAWRELGESNPDAVIDVLALLAVGENKGPSDIWEYGLWGLRAAAKDPTRRLQIMKIAGGLPDTLFLEPEIARASADFLENAAGSRPSPTHEQGTWLFFDRVLAAVSIDERNTLDPEDRDAVSHAINSSMGRLAEAFFALLFSRALKVASKIPPDLRPRLEQLLTPGAAIHRPARVIAASRLSYLFAVDAEWTKQALIPSFDWQLDAVEAAAVWQGYGWQPRIDDKLWPVLKPHFFGVFEQHRLTAMGGMAKTLVQLLMLVCIELEPGDIPNVWVRNVLRAMSDDLRVEALSWIVNFLAQPEEPEEQATAFGSARNADGIWTKRVSPWIEKTWPPDPALRSTLTSEQFAQVAIATGAAFPDAVAMLTPFMVPSDAIYELHQLQNSDHPDNHPFAVLDLIDALTDRAFLAHSSDDLSNILERLRVANPAVANRAVFAELRHIVQANRF